MPSMDVNGGWSAFLVDRLLFHQQRCYRFECHTEVYILSITYTSLNASTMIRRSGNLSIAIDEDVVLLAASLAHAIESLTIFKAFDGIDGQHGTTQCGV